MGFWHENLYLMTPYCVSNEISNSLAITRVVLRNGGGKLEIRQKKKKKYANRSTRRCDLFPNWSSRRYKISWYKNDKNLRQEDGQNFKNMFENSLTTNGNFSGNKTDVGLYESSAKSHRVTLLQHRFWPL